MSEVSTGAGLLPCPFCNADMDRVPNGFAHPLSDDVKCPLEGSSWSAKHYAAAWNQRATPEPAPIITGQDYEAMAAGYILYSGKRTHASDCATSCAPAMKPGPCDCDAVDAPDPAGDLVERVQFALGGYFPLPLNKTIRDVALAVVAAMPDRAALVGEMPTREDYKQAALRHRDAWYDMRDERDALATQLATLVEEVEQCHENIKLKAEFIEATINDCAAKDEIIDTLRTQLAASHADVARLRRNVSAWVEWMRACGNDEDCEYLNDKGWDDAEALASTAMGLLAAIKDTQP